MRITNDEQCDQLICEFFVRQEKFKKHKALFEQQKDEFEASMVDYFEMKKTKQRNVDISEVYTDGVGTTLNVKMINKTSIEWFAEKLEKRIAKAVAKQVIKKQYRIVNMKGLINYLKSCNVNPKEFAKYLSIDKQVDVDAVERLGELGQISPQSISGCYIVHCSKPYFKLAVQKEKKCNGETWE